jgi:hypothetical protein
MQTNNLTAFDDRVYHTLVASATRIRVPKSSRPSPSTSRKKVVVVTFEGPSTPGYLSFPSPEFEPSASAVLDLLTNSGEHKTIPASDVKAVHFVRDLDEPLEPLRRTFLSRPKLEGLWLHLKFRDGDEIEGVVTNDLLAMLDNGLQLTPPGPSGNTQRLFVPRPAIAEVKVLGVVGASRRLSSQPGPTQPPLFKT